MTPDDNCDSGDSDDDDDDDDHHHHHHDAGGIGWPYSVEASQLCSQNISQVISSLETVVQDVVETNLLRHGLPSGHDSSAPCSHGTSGRDGQPSA